MSTKPQSESKRDGAAGAATSVARQRARVPEQGKGIGLTQKAANRLREILEKDKRPAGVYLYVGVKGGGCSGLQYLLDLRDEAHAPIADTDEVFLSHDILMVCDLKSFVVGNLSGTTIDFQEGLLGPGFTFNNPNAKGTCGCGASYRA